MFKEDPLSPAGAYWRNYGMPGIGLFLEGYVVSSSQKSKFAAQLCIMLASACVAGS